jgi:ArsR family transcriptional regulator
MRTILSPALRQDVAVRFRALGDETRLAMLDSLLHDGPQSVGELADAVGASHANVSKHLRVLLECDLVAREKRGNSAIYAIDDPNLAQICELACLRLVELAHTRITSYAAALPREA